MSVRRLAKLARLSTATVSLALRNHAKISLTTRRRVQALARKHGYVADARLTHMMQVVRRGARAQASACLGVISFYDSPRPWQQSVHLARIYDGMAVRAGELGYRLEPMWLRAPGMTPRRFGSILDARGVEGLLCFGSPRVDERMPSEFDHYAIVAQGLSVDAPLHRVINNAYGDTLRVLDRVRALGYRRPGLVVSKYEHERTAYAHLSAYFGWCHRHLDSPSAVPCLVDDGRDEQAVLRWVRQAQPDAIVCVEREEAIAAYRRQLEGDGLRVPRDLGLAAIAQLLDQHRFSGLAENQALIGAWAVELLVSRIINRDFGVPARPRVETVDGVWVDGETLPRRRR